MPYQEELPEVISKKDHVSSVKKDNSRLYIYYISKMEFEGKKIKDRFKPNENKHFYSFEHNPSV